MVQAAINESLLYTSAHQSSETLLSDESISAAELEFARLASLEKSEGSGSAGEPAKRAREMPKILADEVRRDRAEITRGQCRAPPPPFSRAPQATELPILEALSTCAPSPLMLARSAIILRRRANAARSRLSMQTPPPAGQPSLRRAAASAPTPTTRATPARERTRSGVSPASPKRAAPPPAPPPPPAAAAASPSAADGASLTEHEMRIMKGRELLGSRRDETAPRLRRDDAEIMPRCFRDDAEMKVSRKWILHLQAGAPEAARGPRGRRR